MSTKFLEPGGDADFAVATTNGFWRAVAAAPAVATDFVHGGHQRSIAYRANNQDTVKSPLGIFAQAGGRMSFYVYLVALPSATRPIMIVKDTVPNNVFGMHITSTGVLQLQNGTPTQIGSNGPTLVTGKWYRLSVAYTITSTTVNRFEVFVDGVSAISVTNATLTANIAADNFWIGNLSIDTALNFRSSDHYVDDLTTLADTGDVWVTAKRPFANGTTNGFSTQIGAGGSGYGSGHAPQVNERPLSTTNGWSMVGAGSAVTEEYNIEGKSVGDINIATYTIVDYLGWVSASSLSGETASIIVNGSASNISLTSTITMFKKIAGSSIYPAGSGTDIGIITTTALTTVSLYECGMLVAYIPTTPTFTNIIHNNSGVSAATSYATASVTPTANKLQLLAFVSRTNITADPNQPTATGCGLTWVVVGSRVFDTTSSSRRRVTLFRALGASPTTGAITIDCGGQTQTSATWSLDEGTGMDITGSNGAGAIVQSATAFDNSLAVSSLTVTLSAFSNAYNATYGAFGNSNITDHAMSVGSGYTLLGNDGTTTEDQVLTEYETANNTSVVANQVTTSEIGGIAAEIKAATLMTGASGGFLMNFI